MIASVVVTHNPAAMPERLQHAVAQHSRLVVIDNSTDAAARQRLRQWTAASGVALVEMAGNTGIATAQNAGVAHARRAGAHAVLFFDQDSVPDAAAVSALIQAVLADANTVFALLPGDHRGLQDDAKRTLPMRELMSSGSGCAIAVFDRVGSFEDALFIDCVDYEWGWRCQHQGIRLVGLRVGRFEHTLGKSQVRLLGWLAHLDSPARGYYQFRNISTMMRRGYVPLEWKAAQALRSLAKLLVMALAPTQRRLRLALAVRGIRDGWRGRLGPLQRGAAPP